jgi:hypothetical protein
MPAMTANHDPRDAVIEDGGCQDQLPEIAPDGTHFHQDHRHDFHRRDRERRAEEQRGDEPSCGGGNQFFRQGIGQKYAADERHGDAE